MNSKNTTTENNKLTVSKIMVLTAYCVLVCAAITFSFKSLFFTFVANDNNIEPFIGISMESRETLSKAGAVAKLESGEIVNIQKALNNLGYDAGKADGIWGIKTQEALMKFQRAEGINEDESGTAGLKTLEALGIIAGNIDKDNAHQKITNIKNKE